MKFKNPLYRKRKNTYWLEVACGNCKTPIAIYEKAGKGNLIKMQISRIVESEVSLESHSGHIVCINCEEELAKKGSYDQDIAYWIIRGKINTKKISN